MVLCVFELWYFIGVVVVYGFGDVLCDDVLVCVVVCREFVIDWSVQGLLLLCLGWVVEQVVLFDGCWQVIGLFLFGEWVIFLMLLWDIESVLLFVVMLIELSYVVQLLGECELVGLCGEMDDCLLQCFYVIVCFGCFDVYEKIVNLLFEIVECMNVDQGEVIDFLLIQELFVDLFGLL